MGVPHRVDRHGMVDPKARRRSAEKVIFGGESAPDIAAAGNQLAVETRHAELIEFGAGAVQHAEEIVVGNDEQRRGVFEGLVVCEPGRFGMPVRADDRKGAYGLVEIACYCPRCRIGGKEPVRMKKAIAYIHQLSSLMG